jgi:23S rRNA pseudouridine1911/1915/1917 synthase
MVQAREIEVGSEHAGERADRFLADSLGLTRGYVRRLLRRGAVELGGQIPAKGCVLRAGDRLIVAEFRHPSEGPIATPELELPVLSEAGGLIALDKPAGLPTHPLDYDETGTALNAALARHPEIRDVGEGGLQCGVVHRLDRDTSGVLVFALTEPAWKAARLAFAERRVHKCYRARVHGVPAERGSVALRLDHRGARMRVVSQGGREAITRITSVRDDGESALVELELVTGVMHQIRATLAHLGHPVVGDRLYGSTADEPRHWLHATEIRIDAFQASSTPPPELR